MTRVCVKTNEGVYNLKADELRLHGDTLYVYSGDELVGMFRADDVVHAYKTEKKA